MNVKSISSLIEVLLNGPGDDEAPQPHPRFKWKPTDSAALPGNPDVSSDDLNAAPAAQDMTDRVGKHSLNSLIPPNELATVDDLLDQYFAMQQRDPEGAEAWLTRYRPEFESKLAVIVNAILEGKMPEEFYNKWDKLRKSDKRANSAAKKDPKKAGAASRASQRLSAHEKSFGESRLLEWVKGDYCPKCDGEMECVDSGSKVEGTSETWKCKDCGTERKAR